MNYVYSQSGYSNVADSIQILNTDPVIENSSANKDTWTGLDKGYHLVGSMIFMIGTAKGFQQYTSCDHQQSVIYGSGITLSLGMGKEIYDSKQKDNHFSYKDLVADIIGLAIGILILNID
ncbi:MAG: DUF2279 domain-containing protein [Calditrichaceae bacterium]|nr:DUF2279 domain-containing protein [Calditrichaceae bacterium]MBN2710390.1 DUF2279 domain-containing protein [Calditrichaceae bacterium]